MKILGAYMFKIVLCVLLIFTCFMLGYFLSKKLKTRKNFWSDVVDLCDNLILNISFGHKKVKEIILEFLPSCRAECSYLLDNIVKSDFDKNKFSFEGLDLDLSFEEVKYLEEFFSQIGEYDSESETEKIKKYKSVFSGFLDKSEQKLKRYSPLYIKLSIIAGLVISIIFI